MQMGLIITELKETKTGTCHILMRIIQENIRQKRHLPSSELEEIYPTASGKAKEDEEL